MLRVSIYLYRKFMAFALFPISITLKMINGDWMAFPLQVRFTSRNALFKKIVMCGEVKMFFYQQSTAIDWRFSFFIRHFSIMGRKL